MRLMLGSKGRAHLLVSVADDFHRGDFKFEVENGDWSGRFVLGAILIGERMSHGDVEILCDNQDRLRGDYKEVFANYDNPNYIAPTYKTLATETPSNWDGDIAF
jgi:hypothetical protein